MSISKEKMKEYMKTITVLFVDDEEFVVNTMKEIFPLLFKESYYAENGLDGVEICKQHNIDLVITDLSMPKMNGLDMITEIRKLNSKVKIICVSGHNEKEYTDVIKDIGSAFIIKPISTVELYRAIEQVI